MINFSGYGRPIELGNRGILKPGRLRWLRSLIWLVGFTLLLGLSFGSLGEALKRLIPQEAPALQFAAQSAGAAIALAVYILLVRIVERRPASELEAATAFREISIGLLFGLMMFGAVMALLVGSGLYQAQLNGPNPAWKAAGLAISAGVIEELIVRGVILRLIWRSFGPIAAFVVSAALFGAGHLPNPESGWFAAVCIALEAGVMLGAFYAFTGRLWVSIGVHVGWNFTQGYLFGAAVSGGTLGASLATSAADPDYPQWLTGGAFGPEASLPALLVCSSVGFTVLWAAWKAGRFNNASVPSLSHPVYIPAVASA